MYACFVRLHKFLKFFLAVLAVIAFAPSSGWAIDPTEEQPPISLEEAINLESGAVFAGKDNGLPIDIRRDALREGAISFGARAGLARRTYEIRFELEKRARFMDKVYNFRRPLSLPHPDF